MDPHKSTELIGRTAVVTGSSSGIGRAIAIELATAGAAVVVHAGHNASAAEDVADHIEGLGGRAEVVVLDLLETAAHESLVEAAWKWRYDVDIWVNNAGADVLTGPAAEMSFEQKADLLWKVDVLSTIRLARMAAQRMANSGGGSILNIGWDGARRGMAGDSGELFAATKGAIMAFSRSLAQSAAKNVRVNCIAPGWIKTAWGETVGSEWQNRAKDESLLGRWGTPEDIAKVARFLVSDDAQFINGQVVDVNGGFRLAGSF